MTPQPQKESNGNEGSQKSLSLMSAVGESLGAAMKKARENAQKNKNKFNKPNNLGLPDAAEKR